MMQGDAYGIEIEITTELGALVTYDDVKDIEITVGRMTKNIQSGVRYADGLWVYPLTQDESFRLLPGNVRIQIRVVWATGDVEGVVLDDVPLDESVSKEVL